MLHASSCNDISFHLRRHFDVCVVRVLTFQENIAVVVKTLQWTLVANYVETNGFPAFVRHFFETFDWGGVCVFSNNTTLPSESNLIGGLPAPDTFINQCNKTVRALTLLS